MDCNKDGCPGMAHPCTRISYEMAKGWHRTKKSKDAAWFAIAEAFRVQRVRYESEIQSFLEAYRKVR